MWRYAFVGFVMMSGCAYPEADMAAYAVPADGGLFEPAATIVVPAGEPPTFRSAPIGVEAIDLFADTIAPEVGAVMAEAVMHVGQHVEVAVPVHDNVGVTRCELWLNDTSWSMRVTDGVAERSHYWDRDGHVLARVACGDAAGNLGVGPETTIIITYPWHPCRLFVELDETRLPTSLLYPGDGEELFLGALVARTQCSTEFRYVTVYDWDRALEGLGARLVVRDGSGTQLTAEVWEPFAASHGEVLDFLYDTPLSRDVPAWIGIYIRLHVLPGHDRVSATRLAATVAVETEDAAVLVAGDDLPAETIVYPSE